MSVRGLVRPSEFELLTGMARLTSAEDAFVAWRTACAAEGVPSPTDDLPVEDVLRAVERLGAPFTRLAGEHAVLLRTWAALVEAEGEEPLRGVGSPSRLAAPERLDLDALRADAYLAGVVEAAARRLELPTALLSFVLEHVQVHVHAFGQPGWMEATGGIPVEWSFCRHVVDSGGEPMLVEDAALDARVRSSGVLRDGVQSYAGVAVESDHEVLGALCVLGTEPRAWTDEDLRVLEQLRDRVHERLQVLAAA
jgi:GAF domain-containing protein